jgi:cytoskeleton protein RodZ
VFEDVKLPDMVVASAPVVASPDVTALSAVQAPTVLAKVTEPVVVAVPRDKPKVIEPVKLPVPIAAPQVSVKPAVTPKAIDPVVVPAPRAKPKLAETANVTAPVAVPLISGKPEVPLEQLKRRPIHVVFNEESWIEVKDTNGEVLLARVIPAGNEKWIGGGKRAPYHISIGKAKAVQLYYKGREIDLSRYTQKGLVQMELE